jgi:hypothetical protein
MPPRAWEVPAGGTRVPGGGAGPEGRVVSALPRSSGGGRAGYTSGLCGRFLLLTAGKNVAEAFDLAGSPELAPRYNIAPTQPVTLGGLGVSRWGQGDAINPCRPARDVHEAWQWLPEARGRNQPGRGSQL